MNNRWFAVDKEGLGKLVESHGKGRLIAELLQNALDEQVTSVTISLTPFPGRPMAELVVEDDCPEGFKDLAHAYTLFADSYKKDDPEKRGRFNLGEKLVLALCSSAKISTTTGTVVFGEDGQRQLKPRSKRLRGSEFRATLRMTRAEYDEAMVFMNTILIPVGTSVSLNGELLQPRVPLHSFEASLETEIAGDERVLRTTTRKTQVELYEPKAGEIASVYELGLPVVETGDKWHINVCQKVPLNLNRDNVRPAYLKRLRTLVFNEMHSHLNDEDANSAWVQEATSHADCSTDGIDRFLTLRFGENRASYDPTDPEAGKRIQAAGGTIVTGSMLNKLQWKKAKEADAIKPASKVCPTPMPYSSNPDAPRETLVPPDQWTDGIRNIVEYAKVMARELMGVALEVRVTNIPNNFLACYGRGKLTFNLAYLSHRWFEQGPSEEVDELLIHEFGHEYSGDHLSDTYHEALCRLGAKLKRLALEKPDLFKPFLPC